MEFSLHYIFPQELQFAYIFKYIQSNIIYDRILRNESFCYKFNLECISNLISPLYMTQ